jgi:hypothetical protein
MTDHDDEAGKVPEPQGRLAGRLPNRRWLAHPRGRAGPHRAAGKAAS